MNDSPSPELFGSVEVGDDVIFGRDCVLGWPREALLTSSDGFPTDIMPVRIGSRAVFGNGVVVHEGTRIGAGCFLDDRTRIGYSCQLGDGVRVTYGAFVCDRVTIGSNARVAGFTCDAAVIEDGATMFGQLLHEYSSPDRNWWGPDEAAPVVEREAVIGMGAVVVGGVRIGRRSYVAAGAVVTRDVPPESVVVGNGVMTPAKDWHGRRLRGWASREG